MMWTFDQNRSLDVICMGRVAVDLYSEQIGQSIENSQTFRKYLGGCAGNIAVGSARLGLRSSMLSCVGTDAMGQFVKAELQRESVDIQFLQETDDHLTALVILGIMPPERFPLIFYRNACADMEINSERIAAAQMAKAKILLITGTCLSTQKMFATTHHIVDMAKAMQTRVILDCDYRPVLWGQTKSGDGETRFKPSREVSTCYQTILPKCDLIVGTEEEMMIAGNANNEIAALNNIRHHSQAPIVVKRGAKGACVYLDNLQQPYVAPAYPTKVLNVLGAGDAFLSGFLRGLISGESWQTCANYGNACGAIVVTRHGCAPAMPSFSEMQALIEGKVACLNS